MVFPVRNTTKYVGRCYYHYISEFLGGKKSDSLVFLIYCDSPVDKGEGVATRSGVHSLRSVLINQDFNLQFLCPTLFIMVRVDCKPHLCKKRKWERVQCYRIF